MSSYTAVFEYGLPGLLIASELAGQRLVIPKTPNWIQFPAGPSGGPVALPPVKFHVRSPVSGENRDKEGTLVALRVDCIAVGIPVRLSPELLARPPEAWTANCEGEHVHRTLTANRPAAQAIMWALHEWLRTESPYWMTNQASDPDVQPLAESLYDESMNCLDFGRARGDTVQLVTSRDALGRAEVNRLLHQMAAGRQPSVARAFLADAAAAKDLKHKVVLAAFGVEFAVKSKLRQRASATQEILVDLLMGRAQGFTIAAIKLFDKPLKAILGVSLKESDRQLYNLINGLFEDRNRVAHGSLDKLSSEEDLRKEVRAAKKVCDWLDTL